MQTFLKPLTGKEEACFLEMLMGEDEEKSKWAQGVLIERNLRLVAHIVKKYQQPEVEAEDLISIGTVGLIKAVQSFNPKKQSKLGTYAARCIENEILMYFRSRKKVSKEVSIYDPIGTDKEGNEINLLDIIVADQMDMTDIVQKNDDTNRVDALLDEVLDEREREIIIMRYGLRGRKEMTQREIGDKLNISRSYISRIEKKSIQKLRKALKEEE